MILYPFMEQVALDERLKSLGFYTGTVDNGTSSSPPNCGTHFFRTKGTGTAGYLTPEDAQGLGSVSIYRCPSVLGSMGYLDGDIANPGEHNGVVYGPLCSYAMPITQYDASGQLKNWVKNYNGNSASKVRSPFRISSACNFAVRDDRPGQYKPSWEPRDTMTSYWTDGNSNTLLLAEKYMHAAQVGSTNVDASRVAGGFQLESESDSDAICHAGRYVGNMATDGTLSFASDLIVKDYRTPRTGIVGKNSFGSYHPGGLNVLMGDGSVAMSNFLIKNEIFFRLTYVNDGTPAQLP
jgi:prepilin-type processing-associated H-X9-DG protein